MTPAPPIRELQGCRNRGQKGQLPPPLPDFGRSVTLQSQLGADYAQNINTSPQIFTSYYGPAGSTNNQLYYGNFLHSSFVICTKVRKIIELLL